MKAEDKLEEASYFLSKIKDLPDSVNKRKELGFNLSAFVQAWGSVFDVLPYDYAEKYFKHTPERTTKIIKESFKKIAEILENLDNPEPKFSQMNICGICGHRGGKTLGPSLKQKYVLTKIPVVYVPPSIISAGTISPNHVYSFGDTIKVRTEEELVIAGMPETVILIECERVFLLMKKIVKEAREVFL